MASGAAAAAATRTLIGMRAPPWVTRACDAVVVAVGSARLEVRRRLAVEPGERVSRIIRGRARCTTCGFSCGGGTEWTTLRHDPEVVPARVGVRRKPVRAERVGDGRKRGAERRPLPGSMRSASVRPYSKPTSSASISAYSARAHPARRRAGPRARRRAERQRECVVEIGWRGSASTDGQRAGRRLRPSR